jgi:hypothetical protein
MSNKIEKTFSLAQERYSKLGVDVNRALKVLSTIPIERIRILNPRHRDPKKFELIVQSIKNLGLKMPIQVSLRSENEPEGPGFRRPQPDKNHLVFVVVDNFAQGCFQFNLFRWIQVTLEHRELQVVAKIATGLKHFPQPFGIRNIVAN